MHSSALLLHIHPWILPSWQRASSDKCMFLISLIPTNGFGSDLTAAIVRVVCSYDKSFCGVSLSALNTG